MALVDFTGFENWNTTSGYMPDGWAAGDTTRETSTYKSGAACGYVGAAGFGSQNGFTRTLTASEEHATLIVGFWLKPTNVNVYRCVLQLMGDAGATTHVTYRLETTGEITARRGDYSGTTLATAAVPSFASAVWRHYEFKTVLSDTVGSVECRVDGQEIFNVTGLDTKNGGTAAVFDTVRGPGQGSLSDYTYTDDFFIINGDTSDALQPSDFIGAAVVHVSRPTSDGTTTDWTPSTGTDNYALVDESDFTAGTDYVEAAADALLDLYGLGDVTLDAGYTVVGVKTSTIALQTASGTRTIAPVIRSGSTNDAGTPLALTTAARIYERLMPSNPVTSAAWSEADVDALESGYESGS